MISRRPCYCVLLHRGIYTEIEIKIILGPSSIGLMIIKIIASQTICSNENANNKSIKILYNITVVWKINTFTAKNKEKTQ